MIDVRYQELENIFNTSNEIKFKLYSLEYIIRKIDTGVEVFAILYQNRKQTYSSFSDAMNNFTVYNESLIDNIDRIQIIFFFLCNERSIYERRR